MTEIAKTQTTALAGQRESFIAKGDLTGTENITSDDLRLPRVSIAQGLSTQLIEGDSNYIDGLKMFDMFNDLTGEVIGRGPVKFIVVRRDVRRIEFLPRSEGGGIVDLNVPYIDPATGKIDPRNEWSVVDGERIPPKATKFVEFVILMLREGRDPEPIMLSIKDTNKFNRRAIERLTGFIKLRNAPIYAGLYELASKTEKNDSGTFGVPVISNAGSLDNLNVDDATWERNKALYAFAEGFAKSLEGKAIIVDREPGDEDTSFNTDEM